MTSVPRTFSCNVHRQRWTLNSEYCEREAGKLLGRIPPWKCEFCKELRCKVLTHDPRNPTYMDRMVRGQRLIQRLIILGWVRIVYSTEWLYWILTQEFANVSRQLNSSSTYGDLLSSPLLGGPTVCCNWVRYTNIPLIYFIILTKPLWRTLERWFKRVI